MKNEKIKIKAEDYPNSMPRAYRLQNGDCFGIVSDSIPVKVGDKYLDYSAVITEIYYEPKKWWWFWKKKKQLGYKVMWMGD